MNCKAIQFIPKAIHEPKAQFMMQCINSFKEKTDRLVRERTLKDSFICYEKASRKNGSLILYQTDISVYGMAM